MNRSGAHVAWTVRGFVLLAAVLSVAACASANKSALKRASAESSASFVAGDYGKAIEPYRKIYEKNRADGRAVARYIEVIEEVKSAADEARSKGGYASAQDAYRVLAENWDGYAALGPRLSFKKPDLEAGIRDCRLASCERQFRQETGAGNYAKAIAAYQAVLRDYPRDKTVKSRYAESLAEIGGMGDKALAAKDYALAGKIDSLLLRYLESFEGTAGKEGRAVGPKREDLEGNLRVCSAELTNCGLSEYRKGNLKSAIEFWDALLAFDPGNSEIKLAVETAKAQLDKLRRSSPGGRKSTQNGRGIR
jgi:tetratricopeptide (TPR) repeat protein